MSIAYSLLFRRACLPAILSFSLAACSNDMVPPADIDGGTTVSSIETRQQVEDTSYAAPADPASRSAESVDYLDTPNLAGVGDPPRTLDEQRQSLEADDSLAGEKQQLPKIDEEPSEEASAQPVENGVNIDNALGVEQPTSLAEEEANQIAEGNTDQPVVDGIGTDNLTEMRPSAQPLRQSVPLDQAETADQITPPSKRRDTEKETQVAFVPRFTNPEQVPESFGGLTAADRQCRADLERLGVRFRELPPIRDGQNCGIPHPIEVSGFSGGIRLQPAAKLNCPMTRMFAKWVKNELQPSARYRYFSGIQTIKQMSSYSCRKMNSRSNNPWSEHAKGNALDIGAFVLRNGKEIDVRKKSFFAFREKGLLKTVREDSCRYFNTVLGPGDPYHGDHFHFDLRYRKSGYRHCSL